MMLSLCLWLFQAATQTPGQASGDAAALAALEQDMVSLHRELRASLVSVHLSLGQANGLPEEAARAELITSGTVLDNYGLVVVPLDLPAGLPMERLGELTVYRADGESFPAKLLESNSAYGLSLIRAEGLRGLAPPFGVGTWHQEGSLVFTLGNAFGLPASLTSGVLSGRRRMIGEARELLQITNPINQGDAGGILANREGKVIGILLTSLAAAATKLGSAELVGMDPAERKEWLEARQAAGVSFAVPVEILPFLFPDYLPQMTGMRQIGVLVEVKLCIVEEEGKEPSHCWQVVVNGLTDFGPARESGVEAGDIILKLGGRRTTSLQELGQAIMLAPQDTTIEVLRGKRQLSLPLHFATAQAEAPAAAAAKD